MAKALDYIKKLESQIDKLEAENEKLRKHMRAMISAAGLPDAAEACRTVIEWGKQALKGE